MNTITRTYGLLLSLLLTLVAASPARASSPVVRFVQRTYVEITEPVYYPVVSVSCSYPREFRQSLPHHPFAKNARIPSLHFGRLGDIKTYSTVHYVSARPVVIRTTDLGLAPVRHPAAPVVVTTVVRPAPPAPSCRERNCSLFTLFLNASRDR